MVFITTEVCQTSNSINKAMQQFKDEEKQENLWRKKQYALYISQPERIKVCDVSIATDFIHCDIGNSKYLENELQQNLSKPSHMISVSIHLCDKKRILLLCTLKHMILMLVSEVSRVSAPPMFFLVAKFFPYDKKLHS